MPALTVKRAVVTTVAVLLLGGLGAAGWIGYTARSAQHHLAAAAAALPQVRQAWLTGDSAGGAAAMAKVRAEAGAAFHSTHDPVWAVASIIPVLGSPAKTTRGLTNAVNDLATVSLPQLAAISAVADPATLMSAPGTVNVARLAGLAPSLTAAARSLAKEQADVAALPASWLPRIASARKKLLDELSPVSQQAHSASMGAQLLPPMLGNNGQRRYLLAFQNPAEARGTGGLLDAYAVVTADQGKITLAQTGSNAQLPALPKSIPGVDNTYADRYLEQGALDVWVSSNVSPDFPEVAKAWSAMWKASTGQTINGVISLDPAALSAVLDSTGPVTAPSVGTVDAARVVPLIVKEQYTLFPAETVQTADRKSVMLGVGTAAIDKVLAGQLNAETLMTGLAAVAKDDHVNVFSSVPSEQSLLEGTNLSGAVPRTSGPFAQTVVVNSAGTKLDAYLHQFTHYQVTRCGSEDRAVTVTVTLSNDAPASGLPRYVTTWAEGKAAKPGENRVNVQVLLSQAATVRTATLDGAQLMLTQPVGQLPKVLPGPDPVFLSQSLQADRPSFGLNVDLMPGATRTLKLTTVEPASSAAPTLPLQPMANEPAATSDITACG